jgi:GMP synthase (glutamine-hydrolysing)
MSLKIAVLQHEPETGLGAFEFMLENAGVRYEVVPTTSNTALPPEPALYDGAIVLGGSLRASDPRLFETRRWIQRALVRRTPILGVCLGAQLLASALGESVVRGMRPEIGMHDVFLTGVSRQDALFGGLPHRLSVFGWHEDSYSLPRGALPLAGSISYEQQAFRWGTSAYGLQFHPEVRVDDLRRWKGVPRYVRMFEAARTDWEAVEAALQAAALELNELATVLLERWLVLVENAATSPERATEAGAPLSLSRPL